MKSRIFIYLFIFTVLLNLFQYVNSKKIVEHTRLQLESCKQQSEKYNDSILTLEDKIFKLGEFSITSNDNTVKLLENRGIDVAKVEELVKDALYEINLKKGENKLIPYAAMTDGKMIFATIRVLNYQWLIANFNDGEYWGEILLKYDIDSLGNVEFTEIDSFLYPTR